MMANRSTLLALIVASLMLGGSLALTEGKGLKACPTSLDERTFVMGGVGALDMGVVVRPSQGKGPLPLLGLPRSMAGLGLAGFRVQLDRSGVLD